MNKAYLLTNHGAKSIPISRLSPDDFDWLWQGGSNSEISKLYAAVPWLFRGVALRYQALSRVPFAVTRNGVDYDTSDDWQNKAGVLPNPFDLFAKIEAALTIHGAAYLQKNMNITGGNVLGLKWLLPTTITPITSEKEGLIGWKRQMSNGTIEFERDRIVNIWSLNPFLEIGSGSSPAEAALHAAGVLLNVDEFAEAFFKRGAIKSTILTVDGTPTDDQLDKLKSWWRRAVTGMKNAFGTNVFSTQVTPVVIGDGLKELSETTLTNEKREDIATALGVPHSLLFSNAANYATAHQDDYNFYDKTIVPECKLIQSSLNEQLFAPFGLQFEFRHDSMDVFQADEEQRSQAFSNYVNAGMPMSVAAEMLGLELPEGVEYADLDEKEEPEQQPVQLQQLPQQDMQQVDDLAKWRRKASKRLAEGKGAAVEFDSDHISDGLKAAILAGLETVESADEINQLFDHAVRWEGYP